MKRSRPKYNNTKVKLDGHTFDSEGERDRYLELKREEKAGTVRYLTVKPKFDLTVNGIQIYKKPFRPDFMYRRDNGCWQEHDSGSIMTMPIGECRNCLVIEDHKGYLDPKTSATREFYAKINLVKAIYGHTVTVVFTAAAARAADRKKRKKDFVTEALRRARKVKLSDVTT